MDKRKRYNELLKKSEWVRKKINRTKKYLGHPHGQWQSAHDLADSDFKVYTAYSEDIEKELVELEKELEKK